MQTAVPLDTHALVRMLAPWIAARPPVDRPSGVSRLIGITGGPALGKTTVSRCLGTLAPETAVIHLDGYLLPRVARFERAVNGFECDGYDLGRAEANLRELVLNGVPFELGPYLTTGVHGAAQTIRPAPTIILDGTLVWLSHAVRALLDALIVFAADADTNRRLRWERDVHERGYSEEEADRRWESHWPSLARNVLPARETCDLLITTAARSDHGSARACPTYKLAPAPLSTSESALARLSVVMNA